MVHCVDARRREWYTEEQNEAYWKGRWDMEPVLRGRFAPSPSGRMHLGNVFTALLAWLSVRAAGGALVLRMEDSDPDRCRAEYAQILEEDLRWLGLDWDEGYQMGGPHGPYRQSERTELYAARFRQLEQMGLVYPCFCTRAERLAASAPHRGDGQILYSGRCRSLSPQEREELSRTRRSAWRLAVLDERVSFIDGHLGYYEEDLCRACGDFIIRRSDGVYAYQLAVVTDDGAMEMNQVVRGQDLLDSTPRQVPALPSPGPAPAGLLPCSPAAGRGWAEALQAGYGPGHGGPAGALFSGAAGGKTGLFGGSLPHWGAGPSGRTGGGFFLVQGAGTGRYCANDDV